MNYELTKILIKSGIIKNNKAVEDSYQIKWVKNFKNMNSYIKGNELNLIEKMINNLGVYWRYWSKKHLNLCRKDLRLKLFLKWCDSLNPDKNDSYVIWIKKNGKIIYKNKGVSL